MKKYAKVALIGLLLSSGISFSPSFKADAYSSSDVPTTINLNDYSSADIRSYYSSLSSLNESQRRGDNLLSNLKTILSKDQKYYNYDSGNSIWKMYEITDRDWNKSPASALGSLYNPKTNIITGYQYGESHSNPYIKAYYMDYSKENQVRAWGNHSQDGYGINREHLWAKAEGFDTSTESGARGDPMHLVAANGYVNNIHSNYFYGYVNTKKEYTNTKTKYDSVGNNLKGYSKTCPTSSVQVFEPQDADKGDIARAIFYMVARYNNISRNDKSIDGSNPNLYLTNDLSKWREKGYCSTTTECGYMGILSDLLEWNKLDPVDDYEIHRNNLICRNFTNNRNPFIDFPSWADICFGNSTSSVNPATDPINSFDQQDVEKDIKDFESVETFASLKGSYIKDYTSTNEYDLVTSSDQLVPGEVYTIAGKKDNNWYSMSNTEKDNNRASTPVSVDGNHLEGDTNTLRLRLSGNEEEGYSFYTMNYKDSGGKIRNDYLCSPASESANLLKVGSLSTYAKFSISFDSSNQPTQAVIVCKGKQNRNIMRFNVNDATNLLFSCYDSGQKPIYLFKETFDPSSYTIVPTKNSEGKANITLSFGAAIRASFKNALDIKGVTEYGIAYKKGSESYTFKKLQGAFCASIMGNQEISETLSQAVINNHYFQFVLNLNNIPETDWSVSVTASAYIKVNGTSYFGKLKTYSVNTIAQNYLNNYSQDQEVIRHNAFLSLLAGRV